MKINKTTTITTFSIEEIATVRALIDNLSPSFLEMALKGLKIFINLITFIKFRLLLGRPIEMYDTITITASNKFHALLI